MISSISCPFILQVYDGSTTAAPLVIEFSGSAEQGAIPPENHLPPDFLSTGRSLLVTFDSAIAVRLLFLSLDFI